MGIPLSQQARIGAYILRQHLKGRRRYPLVLMLEPLFKCNLACAGCGKIDYPEPILNRRLSCAECLAAVDECGAPVVAIAGGEPLLHKEMPQIVEGCLAKRKVVILCTNALLLEKQLDKYRPHPRLTLDIHLDGDRELHDWSVSQKGVFDRAVRAIGAARARGFRVAINCTLFNNADPERMARFFDAVTAMGVDAIMVSPGYAYERAPDQEHFLNRRRTKELFRGIFARGKGKGWRFGNSPLFLDFLAGNQDYHCTPWGNPTRNVFGWQRPCYLLGEGLEVFMVVRHQAIEFASGALVFPGGRVDPGDRAVAGTLPGGAGAAPEAGALRIAAIRETFEESGVLLARPRGVPGLVDAARLAAIGAAHRAALCCGRRAFAEVLAAEDLVPATDRLVHFAHWITSPGWRWRPRRRRPRWWTPRCATPRCSPAARSRSSPRWGRRRRPGWSPRPGTRRSTRRISRAAAARAIPAPSR